VVYAAKDGIDTKILLALEWLANLYFHIPKMDEQMVRCH